jgi:prepilin-type N-terminal cleavage/methylation domain-containing protein
VRRGFSLVELIIATTLASLVIIAFYSVVDQSRGVQKSVNKKLNAQRGASQFYRVLSKDILQSESIDYKENIMVLKTSHTLHYRFDGNVTYVYHQQNRQLLRAESKLAHDITKDFNDAMLDDISVDILLEEVDAFEVTTDKTKQKVIVYVNQKGEERAYGFKRFITKSDEETSESESETDSSTSQNTTSETSISTPAQNGLPEFKSPFK